MKRLPALLFSFGILLCLLQIWLPTYFLTGDGPCHLYNARMIHDMWSHSADGNFYAQYFEFNKHIDPNWLTHIVLAALMYMVNGLVAEKLLLTAYVLLLVLGGYMLLRKIDNKSKLWPLVIFVFVFNHPLMKGFYNFSFSMAVYLWLVWIWLCYLDRKNIKTTIIFFILTALSFFAHPIGFVFGCVTTGSLLLSYIFSNMLAPGSTKGKAFLKYGGVWAACVMPFVLLLWWFMQQQYAAPIRISTGLWRLKELIPFKYLINYTKREVFLAGVVGVILTFSCGALIIYRLIKRMSASQYDGFVYTLLFGAFVYFCLPDYLLGGGLLMMRAQMFLFILFVCCITYMLSSCSIKGIIAGILFVCFTGLRSICIPVALTASHAVTEYVAMADYIPEHSILLPISFAHSGKEADGHIISDENWIFPHAAQYISTKKSLLLLDNYEANTGYFPLQWNHSINPYLFFDVEGNPPGYAAMEAYEKRWGVAIRYISTWCYDSTKNEDRIDNFMKQLRAHYHVVYTSASGRTVLYEKNVKM